MNKKGQLSIDNSINWLILIIVSVIITPIARAFINDAIAGTNNTLEIIGLNALLPIYWILLIGVIVMYARPQAPNY
jgi:uncharacterized protein (UPF0333 family)